MGWNFSFSCEDLHDVAKLKRHLTDRCGLIGDLSFPDHSLFCIEVSQTGFIPGAPCPERHKGQMGYLGYVPATEVYGNMNKDMDYRPSLWSLATAFMDNCVGDVVAGDQCHEHFLVRRRGTVYASRDFWSGQAIPLLPNVRWVEMSALFTPASLPDSI